MKYYFAPMEGITGYVFRDAHYSTFGREFAPDRYFTPFVVATFTKKLKSKEKLDILPENNRDVSGRPVPLIPQILTNRADEFAWTARSMAEMGYSEVNINLGCPVGTVAAKKKGSGMLQDTDLMQKFLDGVFDAAGKISLFVSIKTRLGFSSAEEAFRLMEIYNQYPIHELTVHARTRQEFYSGQPHLDVFGAMLESAKMPLIYNGNIATVKDVLLLLQKFPPESFPAFQGIMIGRGLVADPALVRKCKMALSDSNSVVRRIIPVSPAGCGRETSDYQQDMHHSSLVETVSATKEEVLAFHKALLQGYEQQYASFSPQKQGGKVIGKDKELVIVNRMKEVWTHMGRLFRDDERFLKNIHKADSRIKYDAAVRMLFANCQLQEPDDGLN